MVPSKKPEWIEIADQDNSEFPRKVSKGLPVMALVVTASILGIGGIFAQTAEESPANAVAFTAPAAPISQSTDLTTATIATQSNETQNSDEAKNPSIGTLPAFAEEDDDDDDEGEDDEGDEYEGDEYEGDDD